MGRPANDKEEKYWCGHCKHWEAKRIGISEPKVYRCDRCGEKTVARSRVRTVDVPVTMRLLVGEVIQKGERLDTIFGVTLKHWPVNQQKNPDVVEFLDAYDKLIKLVHDLAEERDGYFFAWTNCDRNAQALHDKFTKSNKE